MEAYLFPTVENVRDAALNEALGATGTFPTALQNTALIREINLINAEFINASFLRGGNGWSWMNERTIFQSKNTTALNGAITTASTSALLDDSSDFSSSGRFWVKTGTGAVDFIDYTSNSSNTLSGVTGIDISHADGEKVGALYAQPSDYAKTRQLIENGSLYQLVDLAMDNFPSSGQYTTKGAYFFLPEDIGERDFTLDYIKKPTNLSTGVDATDLATSMNIPKQFYRYAVDRLKAYIFSVIRREDKESAARQEAARALNDALSYDMQISAHRSNRITPSFYR